MTSLGYLFYLMLNSVSFNVTTSTTECETWSLSESKWAFIQCPGSLPSYSTFFGMDETSHFCMFFLGTRIKKGDPRCSQGYQVISTHNKKNLHSNLSLKSFSLGKRLQTLFLEQRGQGPGNRSRSEREQRRENGGKEKWALGPKELSKLGVWRDGKRGKN